MAVKAIEGFVAGLLLTAGFCILAGLLLGGAWFLFNLGWQVWT